MPALRGLAPQTKGGADQPDDPDTPDRSWAPNPSARNEPGFENENLGTHYLPEVVEQKLEGRGHDQWPRPSVIPRRRF